jgi:hypothetical protein
MKGVIVQVGEPKSIALFNNGKISAIPTPADCHVGMVVTVKYNNKLKILAITLAAVLLLGAGVFIGAFFVESKVSALPAAAEMTDDGTHGWQRGQELERNVLNSENIPYIENVPNMENIHRDPRFWRFHSVFYKHPRHRAWKYPDPAWSGRRWERP